MMSRMQTLRCLWRGQLPLEIAFWHFAIFYGLILNLATSTVSVILLLQDAPAAWFIAVHLLPLPYSVVTACGVWRSADNHAGRGSFATFSRVGVVLWFCFWLAV